MYYNCIHNMKLVNHHVDVIIRNPPYVQTTNLPETMQRYLINNYSVVLDL